MDDLTGVFLARPSIKTVLTALSLVVGASNANATDSLPIADGPYMRSADYCEQFRQGKLDSIEFSVSKGGHYYEFPESGCVVATVKPLRTNRYAVDADCMRAANVLSSRSFWTLRVLDPYELMACN